MLLTGNIILARLISYAIVLLISMTLHEFAHNYIGYRMGDTTPRDMGHLTLNPMKHIYWPGWLMWVVIGFGILGFSAPLNPRRMRDPRWGYFWAVAAGPLTNLLIAIAVGFVFRFGLVQFEPFYLPRQVLPTVGQFFSDMLVLNVYLFLFNLIPVFGFDGWFILRQLLPPQQAYVMDRYRNESMIIFIVLIGLGFINIPVLSWIIGPPANLLLRVLTGL